MAEGDEILAYEEDVVPVVVLSTVAFLGVFITLPVLLLAGYLRGKRPRRMSRRIHPSEDHPTTNDFEVVTEKDEWTQISLEEGDDIMEDMAQGDVPFTVRPVADPLKPHEGFHLEDTPGPMQYNSPEDMKDKGMQTDPRKKKKNKKPKPEVLIAPRRAASNIEIFTPNNNTVNPFKPLPFASETAMVRKRLHRDHYDDRDKAVQAPDSQDKVKDKAKPPLIIPKKLAAEPPTPVITVGKPAEKTGKPLTSTKPKLDTTTKSQPPTRNNEPDECEVCPGFNPEINWADLTWLQLFQYMQADGGWYSCRGKTNDKRGSGSTRNENPAGVLLSTPPPPPPPPVRELYKSKVNIPRTSGNEETGEIQEASLSKKHHGPHHHHHHKKSKKKDKSRDKDKDMESS